MLCATVVGSYDVTRWLEFFSSVLVLWDHSQRPGVASRNTWPFSAYGSLLKSVLKFCTALSSDIHKRCRRLSLPGEAESV